MYSKEVTTIILADWAKGASAEETRKHLEDTVGISPCLNTIYTHRNGLTAQMLVDELLRQQQRDIVKADNPALRMKYRDLLLAKLMPQRVEQKIEGGETIKFEIVDNSKDPEVSPTSPTT